MYTDTVVEFFVVREKGKLAMLKNIAVCVLTLVLLLAVGAFGIIDGGSFFAVAFALAVGVIALAVFLFSRQNIEYEYSFFSGELTIDKIVNKSKRSAVLNFELKNVDEMGRYEAGKTVFNDGYINCSNKEDGNDAVYLRVPSSMIEVGKKVSTGANFTYILLENNERVQKAIKPFIRASVYREGMKSFN